MSEPHLTKENSPWWAKLTEIILLKFSGPMIMLAVVCYALYLTGAWLLPNVVRPIVNAHLNSIDALGTNLEAQTVNLEAQTKLMRATNAILTDIEEDTKANNQLLKENQELIKRGLP